MKFVAIGGSLLLAEPLAAHAAPEPSLEQRVQRMEDESQIRKMVIEYGAYLDAKDYAAYAGLFAPDGVWVGGFGSFTGPPAIEKMLTDNLGPPEPGYVNKSSFHMLTNPIIEIDGDHAHVTSKYLFWTKSADNRPTPLLAGRYVDEFVRVNGEWKIAKRTTYGAIPYRDPDDPAQNDNTTAPSLEARLAKAEATLAIQRVITDYAARLDAEDFDGYAALFAKDGTWQTGQTVRHGPAEIKAMLAGLYGTPPAGFVNTDSYHLVSNIEVDVLDADHAKARSRHLLIMRDANGDPRPALAGRYEDEFVREDGQWKILHRTDFPVMPSADQWLKEIRARQQKK
jgi:uncharacterized protein (TIGR02246 family)